jgi:hypothetical protein
MAKTGDIYTAVEELKVKAADAFTGIENDDDLDSLVEDVAVVRDRAINIITVVLNVSEVLTGLVKK